MARGLHRGSSSLIVPGISNRVSHATFPFALGSRMQLSAIDDPFGHAEVFNWKEGGTWTPSRRAPRARRPTISTGLGRPWPYNLRSPAGELSRLSGRQDDRAEETSRLPRESYLAFQRNDHSLYNLYAETAAA